MVVLGLWLRGGQHAGQEGQSLLNKRERIELFFGVRELPLRLIPALGSALLLYLSGDMVGIWPLCWVALIPLCFACRGAGAAAAFILSFCAFGTAAVAGGFWLGSPGLWFAAALLPALAFFTIELPICRYVPRMLRPVLMAALAAGFWSLLPDGAAMLIPFGGLMDGAFLLGLYPLVTPPVIAGLLTGLAWLAAEFHGALPEEGIERMRWPGYLLAGMMLLTGGIEYLGVMFTWEAPTGDGRRVYVVPDGRLGPDYIRGLPAHVARDSVVFWGILDVADSEERREYLESAGRIAEERRLTLAVVSPGPFSSRAYIWAKEHEPVVARGWDGPPGYTRGEAAAAAAAGIALYPSLEGPDAVSPELSILALATAREPRHRAEATSWLREQRRAAMRSGRARLLAWRGGGAIITGDGRIAAAGEGGVPLSAQLPVVQARGDGRERYPWAASLTGFIALFLWALAILATTVLFARRRKRPTPGELAIEELYDGQPGLSPSEKDTITKSMRSFRGPDRQR